MQIWEAFEGRWQSFESTLSGIEEKSKHLDHIVRNKDHVASTKRSIEVMNLLSLYHNALLLKYSYRNCNLKPMLLNLN